MVNRYGYNGGNEYEDEGELNYSNTFYRKYDAQIGRFTGIDILAEEFINLTPYNFGNGNPFLFNDPSGALNSVSSSAGRPQKGPDGNYGEGGGSGGGGGGTGRNFTNYMGITSSSILSKMSFGQSFGQNKRGEYGFWSSYIFNTGVKGDGKVNLDGIGVGTKWKRFEAQNHVDMTFPPFSTLWNNYPPDVDGEHAHPSVDPYPNQCAIRVSYTFVKSGINMTSYPKVNKTTDGYARSSKGLADWTWQNFGKPIIMTQRIFERDFKNSTGLIYISPPPGGIGHIDLFNAGKTGSGYYLGSMIWFWPIK
jgi:RHS repeat-associated protein